MKKTILLFFTVLMTLSLNAQNKSLMSFIKDPDKRIYSAYIDTLNKNNIWQIGKNHKAGFDTIGQNYNVLMTDTITPYPNNNNSSFYINYKNPTWVIGVFLDIEYLVDSDSLNDFLKIEYSTNNSTWHNIYYKNYQVFIYKQTKEFYSKINDSTIIFTGKTPILKKIIIEIMCNIDTAKLRFTFISDSISNKANGLLIKKISLEDFYCENIQESNTIINRYNIYPNPVVETSIIQLPEGNNNIVIYNMMGEKIKTLSNNENSVIINKNNYKKGVYFYRIININDKNVYYGKFIIN